MSRGVLLAVVVVALAACAPTFGPSDSLVTSTRVLAVRAEPAEGKPGEDVTFTALVARPDGTVTDAAIAWSFCTAPKPLTEDNVVSRACLTNSALVPIGAGASAAASLPTNGCSVFGPDTSTSGLRPRDPDGTGGYYQPLRVSLSGAPDAFALVRLRCNLAQADAIAASAFAAAYRINRNPELLPLVTSVERDAIPAGSYVTLRASWASDSAEEYAGFDVESQSVTRRREAMRVAWYVSDGELDAETTGRAETDPLTTTDDGWTAPARAGVVHLWIVLHDSRGGVAFAGYDLVVR